MQSKQPSVSIPQYNQPNPTGFNTPYGSVGFSGTPGTNGAYNYNSADPSGDLELQTMRDALTASLTPTGPGVLSQTQDWQTAFTQAALKNAAPQLSNQLFNAGLGGSAAYGNALGDLYSNTSTQAVLNAQGMANSANQTNANSLNSVNSAIGQNQNYALNLQQLANTYNTNANQQALSLYQTQLPYKATVNNNQGAGFGALIGSVLGGTNVGSTIGAGVDSAMGNTSVGLPIINGINALGNSAVGASTGNPLSVLQGLQSLQGAGFYGSSPLNTSSGSYYGNPGGNWSPTSNYANNGGQGFNSGSPYQGTTLSVFQ